jgi:hypothetical protein
MIGNNSANACAQMLAKKENHAKKFTASHFVQVAVMTARTSLPWSAELLNQVDH